MRLIILAVLIYLLYRLLKKHFLGSPETRVDLGRGEVDDEMIKDPQCHTYYPKRNMISQKVNGQTLYFCSEACKKAYLEAHTKNGTGREQ